MRLSACSTSSTWNMLKSLNLPAASRGRCLSGDMLKSLNTTPVLEVPITPNKSPAHVWQANALTRRCSLSHQT